MYPENVLKRIALAGIYVLPFIALVFSNDLIFPFVTARNLLFRAIVELMFCAWLGLALLDPAYRPARSPLLLVLAGFTVWIGLADLLSLDPARSFLGSLERMEGYITTLHLLLYVIVTSALLRTVRQWQTLFYLNIAGSLAVVVLMAADERLRTGFASEWRLEGTLGQASYLAVFMLFSGFFTLLVLIRARHTRWLTAGLLAALCIQLAVLFMTATRGAMLGVLAGAALAGGYWLLTSRSRVAARLVAGTAVVLVLALAALLLVPGSTERGGESALGRLSDFSAQAMQREPRLHVWRSAVAGIGAHPLAGWGQENFDRVFNRYYAPELWYAEPWFDRAHNQFLDWGVAAGIPGLLLYIGIFAVALRTLLGASSLANGEKAVMLGLLGAYAVNNVFAFDNIVSLLQFHTVLAWLHVHDARKSPLSIPALPAGPDPARVLAAPLVCLLGLGLMLALNLPVLQKASLLRAANAYHAAGHDPGLALQKYVAAAAHHGISQQEVVDYLTTAATAIVASPDTDAATRQQWFAVADESMRAHRSAIGDGDARMLVLHSLLLSADRQFAAANTLLGKAAELAPQKQGIYIQLGNNALSQNDYAGAAQQARIAFELAPDYAQARLFYATTLILTGQFPLADAILAPLAGAGGVIDQEQILNAYFAMGQQDRVLAILRQRADANPGNVDYKLALGATLRLYGRTDEVQALLEQINALHPEAAEQARLLLQ